MNCVWPMAPAHEPVKFCRRDDALLQDLERGDILLARIVLLAAGIEQGRERAHDPHRALVLAEIAFHAPDGEQDVAVDLVALLDRGEQIGFARLHACARCRCGSASPPSSRYCEVVEVNSGWLLASFEHVGIGLADAGEGAVEHRARYAGRLGARPQCSG